MEDVLSMTEMIERVARAICAAESAPDEAWPSYRGHARAAILALRTPNEGMIEAGGHKEWGGRRWRAVEMFSTMIDAALRG